MIPFLYVLSKALFKILVKMMSKRNICLLTSVYVGQFAETVLNSSAIDKEKAKVWIFSSSWYDFFISWK